MFLTNPPFGESSSITIVTEEGEQAKQTLTYNRPDFWVTTSNKQLNFVQHVKSLLEIHGRAAVVVPDNVLFESGAGEKVRRKLLQECDVHTLLRLPTWFEETPDSRWRSYDYNELMARDKANLDIFRLRDESLEDSADLPEPHVLAGELADDLRSSGSRSKRSWGTCRSRLRGCRKARARGRSA